MYRETYSVSVLKNVSSTHTTSGGYGIINTHTEW